MGFGTPMAPLSPIIANMLMEDLEQRALTIFPNPPSIWVRYVDDVYAIMETEHIESFHQYLNTINSSIQFTKGIEASGSLAFLDVFLHREADGSFSTNVYRKPTHTGRYLLGCFIFSPFLKLKMLGVVSDRVFVANFEYGIFISL